MNHLVAILVLISVVPLDAKLVYRRPSPCSPSCPHEIFRCNPCKCDARTDLRCRQGEFCTLESSWPKPWPEYVYWSCYTATKNGYVNTGRWNYVENTVITDPLNLWGQGYFSLRGFLTPEQTYFK
ncbi:hypothetical protein HELRODRAFT_178128 [Helobdella robusta]|uniref:Uncharacterized protein n=1 Tax=Helobdella robusta TaxID=6412 RepID=T1FCS8_HELRO|nr:hypothetical protein HELRODRAFT_178128 [Helobdella robusta]ESN97342.1 hypothetical protein HELRODRAFT_178128 [Helobdella robusta]